ncbi:hypothetical protein [Lentzea sp. HUAS12]|uniref:hypothetical protein n=1 Tax=Lentzea sp. HUAS12 TaxID=2951806 RepID=UPI00209C79B2|nr:hypothetical protein [Lentzea sp. HUAS12]USX54450.1 hypothetical protein ND450_10205 [Lentzea sp. HUAS12]
MRTACAGELMTAVARGDQAAFGRLYDLLAGAVFGLVTDALRAETGHADPAAAEDAALDAWTHIWRNAPALLHRSSRPPSSAEAVTWILHEVRTRCSAPVAA